jgi:hypothetical protein
VNVDGSFDWAPFSIDMKAPGNAAAVEVEFQLYAPKKGEGRLLLDDLAYVEWAPKSVDVNSKGVALPSPNAWDFVRCETLQHRQTLELTLTHRVYASG